MVILKKILIAVIALTVLIAVTGFLILPAVLKPVVTKKITEALRREAVVDRIKINPFALSATITGFKLADPGQKTQFVAFDELHVNVAFLTSIFRRALILEELRLDKPYISITRNKDGTYNFSDLLPQSEPEKEKPAKPFLFSLNDIQITQGNIDFRDLPNKTNHTIRELRVAIPFLSNIDYYMKNHVQPDFSAVVNGHSIAIAGKTQPFLASRSTSLDIDLKDVDVPFYLQYAPLKMNSRLTEARLDTKLQLKFIIPENQSTRLELTGQVALRKIAVDDLQGNRILRIPDLSVKIASIEPFTPKAHLAEIALNSPQLVIRRNKQGNINLLNLIGTATKEKSTKSTDGKEKSVARTEKKKELDLLIDALLINKADITFLDAQPSRPVQFSINPLRLSVNKFSLKKEASADIDLELVLNKNCNITAQGPVVLDPLKVDLNLAVKNLAIRPFQPYFPDSVKLDITRGSISTTGKLSLRHDKNKQPGIKYAGNLSVANLATIDKIHEHDFLKFKHLNFQSLAAGYNPLFVNIKDIAIADFFAKIVINKGGSTNIQDIFGLTDSSEKPAAYAKTEPPPPVPSTKAAPPPDIKIGKIRFQGGTVDFTDHNIQPNYAVTMLNLKGDVTGLSSQEISRAKVDLRGNIGYGSPLKIAGVVNPLKKDLFADIKISFQDLEMNQVTPYTSKYLGYPIIKGKLNFDVSYLVDQRKLQAENKVFFDQLTFGDKVESPDAIKAPVTLAVSLLTDRKGQINLDIPLSGSLDDPQFKIWPIVWQILVNLITKAVTAPFSLLASLTGGGEELSFVEFDCGSANPDQVALKKINALEKALYERPNLKLEIEGYIDSTQDKEALKKAEFNRLIKTQKLREIIDQGQTPMPVADIVIAPNEYEKYLTEAYKAAKIAKPRTALGLAKKLPVPEMAKLISENITVTDSNLDELASRRAQSVREQLLKTGKIEPGRIFIVKPKTRTPEKKEKVKDSRVDFKLK